MSCYLPVSFYMLLGTSREKKDYIIDRESTIMAIS